MFHRMDMSILHLASLLETLALAGVFCLSFSLFMFLFTILSSFSMDSVSFFSYTSISGVLTTLIGVKSRTVGLGLTGLIWLLKVLLVNSGVWNWIWAGDGFLGKLVVGLICWGVMATRIFILWMAYQHQRHTRENHKKFNFQIMNTDAN